MKEKTDCNDIDDNLIFCVKGHFIEGGQDDCSVQFTVVGEMYSYDFTIVKDENKSEGEKEIATISIRRSDK